MKQKLMKFIGIGLVCLSFSVLTMAQTKIVPFFEVKSGSFLGGFENGKYLDAKTAFGRLQGEGSYSLFGLKGKIGELTATVESPGDPCDDFYPVEVELEVKEGLAIGAGRNWNAVPRTPQPISLTDKTYLKIVADILRLKGFPRSKAIIEQAVRVDLDNDGVDEVLLTASNYGGEIKPRADAGNYSFVLLRKVVAGKVKNIFLAEEYVKKNIEFGAPNRFDISGIADLNGDKRMEIVIFWEYYEGQGASVFEIKGNQAVEIKELEAGCGV